MQIKINKEVGVGAELGEGKISPLGPNPIETIKNSTTGFCKWRMLLIRPPNFSLLIRLANFKSWLTMSLCRRIGKDRVNRSAEPAKTAVGNRRNGALTFAGSMVE